VLDLDPAAREVVRLLDGVNDDQLWAPTPSEDTSVARLLDHIAGLALAFTWAARKTPLDGGSPPPSASADALDPDWRKVIPQRLGELVEAWRDPAAWERTTQAGGVTMPAEAMGVVVLDELVLHGWDLAKATGQDFRCDPAHAAVVLEFTADSAKPENAAGRQGLFGPVVEVPEDTPVFDRALGYAGRDPAWTPARARPA
jgi:uncharacterized protein (TIGR03086 family)